MPWCSTSPAYDCARNYRPCGEGNDAMADNDLLDNAPDDDDDGDGIDLEGNGKKPASGRQAPPDDDDDDDDPPGDDDTDNAPAGKTYTQEDIDNLKGSLANARKEAREKIGDLRRQIKELQKKPPAGNTADNADALAQAREEATADAVKLYKPVAVRAAAKAAFLEAKLQNPTDARINRLFRNLDMDDIEVDPDDGSITGLDEQIEALVEEFAEMFGEPAPAPEPAKQKRIPRGDAADRRRPPEDDSNLSTGARMAKRILRDQGARR